jgi:hypothetical protein
VSAPLSDELQQMSSLAYGPTSGDWNGEALASAIRSFSVLSEDEAAQQNQPLPPLMPAS